MAFEAYILSTILALAIIQVSVGNPVDDKYEPQVAFICDRPAMHRGVSGWIADRTRMDCPEHAEDILAYCRQMYPDHNITNIVESSRIVDIPEWPMENTERRHPHRVRPFRCLVGGFQSDALLVPQHCEFDHKHNQSTCQSFAFWNKTASMACQKKGFRMESLGMLLICDIAKFSGVEYVCCPTSAGEPRHHELTQSDDRPDSWIQDVEEGGDESVSSQYTSDSSQTSDSQYPDENKFDAYEAYLRLQKFPKEFDNEHKKFLSAKDRMKKNQRAKMTRLLQQWQAARDHVNEVRKTDPKKAEKMDKEIPDRFQRLYASYEQEDAAEKQQLIAVHLQRVQAALNERKRDAMDKYMKALEDENVDKISKYLHAYIRAEEKDRMHTVNHFEHVKYTSPREALRIHPHIVEHLKVSEQRIDQALSMLTRYPDLEQKVRPEIEEFLQRFNQIADNIKNIVLPVPKIDSEEESSESSESNESKVISDSIDDSDEEGVSEDSDFYSDSQSDEVWENEHDMDSGNMVANAQSDRHGVRQGLDATSSVTSTAVGSTVGIALGSVSVFVIIIVAIIMLRKNSPKPSVGGGYVEVDPAASPEERHLANMQMNGYENPTYKYFEVQANPKA